MTIHLSLSFKKPFPINRLISSRARDEVLLEGIQQVKSDRKREANEGVCIHPMYEASFPENECGEENEETYSSDREEVYE